MPKEFAVRERVRLGMVGGGKGAFIGAVHRAAASLDGLYTLTAGALSSDPDRAKQSGDELGLDPARTYTSWQAMLDAEHKLPPNQRIEAVAIVTPNATHYEIARACIDAGFHVIIDKPMTTTVEQAIDLVQAVERAQLVCAVTYTYAGYPMVRHARELVRSGQLGPIRRVCVEYHQGWLATNLESTGQKQAAWRTDPALAGPGGAIGDIGTHAAHLLHYITGLNIESLCADLSATVPGRKLDDDAVAILRLTGGVRATLSASQICIGEENNLDIRVFAEHGSIRWNQESPNHLELRTIDAQRQTLTRGTPTLSTLAQNATRLPTGHPEGFIEALANIYKDAAQDIIQRRNPDNAIASPPTYPTARDGLLGVRFINAMLNSAKHTAWTKFES
mgnify:CR=1 FL=1